MRPYAKSQITLAAGLLAAMMLSGCGVTTYGTGVDPGTQTIKDLTNVLRLMPSAEERDKKDIEYQPRAGIVAPPNNELPPPGAQAQSQTAANWPTDPEEVRRRIKAEADAAASDGKSLAYDPGIRITGQRQEEQEYGCGDESDPRCMFQRVNAAKGTLKPNTTRGGSVDEIGTPTRKYLVEPPVEYRKPSTDAPVVVSEETDKQRKGGGFLSRLWPF